MPESEDFSGVAGWGRPCELSLGTTSSAEPAVEKQDSHAPHSDMLQTNENSSEPSGNGGEPEVKDNEEKGSENDPVDTPISSNSSGRYLEKHQNLEISR